MIFLARVLLFACGFVSIACGRSDPPGAEIGATDEGSGAEGSETPDESGEQGTSDPYDYISDFPGIGWGEGGNEGGVDGGDDGDDGAEDGADGGEDGGSDGDDEGGDSGSGDDDDGGTDDGGDSGGDAGDSGGSEGSGDAGDWDGGEESEDGGDSGEDAGDSGGSEGGGDEGDSGGDDGGGTGGDDDGGDDDGDAIEEADIIRVEEDRLYALSGRSGLTVVDVQQPDALRVLGNHRASADPFEMYVSNGRILTLYSEFLQYVLSSASYEPRRGSRVQLLDATAPEDIVVEADLPLPGRIIDSRLIGKRLYVATYENEPCLACDPRTTVFSFYVSSFEQLTPVDDLVIAQGDADFSPISLAAGDGRLYVASSESETRSRIDIIDVSDSSGRLARGATVEPAGRVQSRWQVDEYDGVLRVISQSWGSLPPVVETFALHSSSNVVPLGTLELALPRPEDLRAATFDGSRAYAVTFDQSIFSFDLTDPTAPRMGGEFPNGGSVHHLMPRGERLLGLGFEDNGALTVSLFDVEALDNPTLLKKVDFGGDWGEFNEDPDRLHKSFSIDEQVGLIMVPFSAWSWDHDTCRTWEGGVQLIDYSRDDLTLRGLAEVDGLARRAFIHRDALFTVGSHAVETFDISTRASPRRLAGVQVASQVERIASTEAYLARLTADWDDNRLGLDLVPRDEPDSVEPVGRLDLDDILDGSPVACSSVKPILLAHEDFAFLLYEDVASLGALLTAIDLRQSDLPTVLRTEPLPLALDREARDFPGFYVRDEPAILIGSNLVITEQRKDFSGEVPNWNGAVVILDVGDPAHPEVLRTFARPRALQYGRLRRFGDLIVSWYAEQVDDEGLRAAFHLERIDLSNPARPIRLPAVNIPGVPVAYDGLDRILTVDFRVELIDDASESECRGQPKFLRYDRSRDDCWTIHHDVNLVELHGSRAIRLDLQEVAPETRVRDIFAATTGLFAVAEMTSGDASRLTVAPMGNLSGGKIEGYRKVALPWEPGARRWLGRTTHSDLLLSAYGHVFVVEGRNREPSPSVQELPGAFSCEDIQSDDEAAYCALGGYGLEVIELSAPRDER